MYDHHCFITYDGEPRYRISRIARDRGVMRLHLRHDRVRGCFVTVEMQWTPDKLRDYCKHAHEMTRTQTRHVEQFLAEPRFSR